MLHTIQIYFWSVYSQNYRFNDIEVFPGLKKSQPMIFDPGYPYIHFQSADFKTLSNWLNNYYGPGNIGNVCNNGKCVITKNCSEVDISMSLELFDNHGNSFVLSLDKDDLLFQNEFEAVDNNTCPLPFFSQNNFAMNIFGNVAMKKYYTVFDAQSSTLYNRIGIGLKNPVDVIGQDMINNGQSELRDYQYMVAAVLVMSAVFLFVIVHYYCKSKQDDFNDEPPQVQAKTYKNALNHSEYE